MSLVEISVVQDKQWRILEVFEVLKIDGCFDEEFWERFVLCVDILYEVWLSDNDFVGVCIEVFFVYMKMYFYVVFKVYELNFKSICVCLMDCDIVWNDDQVGFIVDIFNNQCEVYYFNVNLLGIQMDWVGCGFGDLFWDGVWELCGCFYDWGYVVEIEILFLMLCFQLGDDEQMWGFDVQCMWFCDD